jgi:hypothetical protein
MDYLTCGDTALLSRERIRQNCDEDVGGIAFGERFMTALARISGCSAQMPALRSKTTPRLGYVSFDDARRLLQTL